MGEYEDRYPEAYGRGEEVPTGPAEEGGPAVGPPRQVRDTRLDQQMIRETGHGPLPERPGDAAPISARAASPARRDMARETGRDMHGPYRGIGPRNYRRSAERIREDVCDRLMDDPFIDPSGIDVRVNGTEVTLDGVVENRVSLRHAQGVAEDVLGVTAVHNRLRARDPGERRDTPSTGAVNRAIAASRTRRWWS